MNSQPLRLRLTWNDTATGDCRSPILDLPIALGRIFEAMPATINGERVSRIALSSSQVSRFHGVIGTEGDSIVLTDTGSRNGTFVNGVRQTRCVLANGDMLQVGPYEIGISFAVNSAQTSLSILTFSLTRRQMGQTPGSGRKGCRHFLKQVVGENFRRSHFCTLLK